MTAEAPRCDVLVISPHTDDLEIGLGGTVRLLANAGRCVWGLDLTRGELGTNATPDERWTEAAAASAVLGLAGRLQLSLPDGFVAGANPAHVEQVGAALRRLCPRWVITAPDAVRHPDHIEVPHLVARAVYLARLLNWQPQLGPHRVWSDGAELPRAAPSWLVESVWRVSADGEKASALFDVSDVWAEKVAALACYRSQFGRSEGQRRTAINDPSFGIKIERRAHTWGRMAGVKMAEALTTESAPVFIDLPAVRWSS